MTADVVYIFLGRDGRVNDVAVIHGPFDVEHPGWRVFPASPGPTPEALLRGLDRALEIAEEEPSQ